MKTFIKSNFNFAKPLHNIIPNIIKRISKKQNLIHLTLITDWHEIIGPKLASQTKPTTLSSKGILHLKTNNCIAVEIQHCLPIILGKINRYFGKEIVTKIKISQTLFSQQPSSKQLSSPTNKAKNLTDALNSLEKTLKHNNKNLS